MKTRSLFAGVALSLCAFACGDDDTLPPPPPPMDTMPVLPPAQLDELVVFEGQRRQVNSVSVPLVEGLDLTGATIGTEAGSPVEVLEFQCNFERCGVVLKVNDVRPNRGVPVPAPIDSENHFLLVNVGEDTYRALMSVRPLDELTNPAPSPSTVTATPILAAAASSIPGGTFVGNMDAKPFRWVVFGEARFEGDFDLSDGKMGGLPGGEMTMNAPMGGEAGTAGAGAGGGGHREAGANGEGETAGAGGPVRNGIALSCLASFDEERCGGGGGGGGASTAGGAGGGGLLLVSTTRLDLTGATIDMSGQDGQGGAGGGAGGALILAAPELTFTSANVSGGAADTPGGAGAAGRVRIDSARFSGEGEFFRGPAADVMSIPEIVDVSTLMIDGVAEPDTPIILRDVITAGPRFTTTTGADGTFSVEVTLNPGLNRFLVEADVEGERIRSWCGNGIEFGRLGDDRRPLPLGATVDIAFVPPGR